MMIHKIWKVRVGSLRVGVPVQDHPVLTTYLIESRFKNGIPTLKRKALKLAAEDGISQPIVVSMEWINSPYTTNRAPD